MMNLSIGLLAHHSITGVRGDQEVLRRKYVAVLRVHDPLTQASLDFHLAILCPQRELQDRSAQIQTWPICN